MTKLPVIKLDGWYPGTTTKVHDYEDREVAAKVTPSDPEHLDLGEPIVLHVKGEPVEFFTIGVLAAALNRKPVTIRQLEARAMFPKSSYRDPKRRGTGKRRLYTRAQIQAAVRIATEEGVMKPGADLIHTQFSQKLNQIWRSLAP